MSSVTLTAATRQNLLSLQDTANLLSTTQSHLSTGKKVNSALDNPINYFTSQSLSARSGDLSALLDGISNGIQTVQAANQGITSITKLLETAKSTASQALADKTGGSSGVTGGATAQAAKVTGSATLASLGTTDAAGKTTFDLSGSTKDASLEITLGGNKSTIRIDSSTLASSGTDLTKVSSDQLLTAINGQIANNSALAGKVSASTSPDGRITFATTATGAAATLTVAGSANATVDIGYGKSTTTPTPATVTAKATLAATTDFSTGSASLVVSDGNTSVQVRLDKNSATDNLGGKLGTSATQVQVRDAINKQLKDNGSTATVSLSGTTSGSLVFNSADVGPDAQISVIGGTDTTGGNGAAGIGFSTFTASTPTASTPAAANTAVVANAGAAGAHVTLSADLLANVDLSAGKSASFSVDGTAVTINATTVDSAGHPLGTNPAKEAIADAIGVQLSGYTVSFTGSKIDIAKAGANVAITAATDTIGLGIGTANTLTATNTATTPSASTPAKIVSGGTAAASTLTLTGTADTFKVGDGTNTANISISSASVDKAGNPITTSATQAKVAEAIQVQLDAQGVNVTAAYNNNKLEFTSKGVGTSGTVVLTPGTDAAGLSIGAAGTTNLPQTATGVPAGSIDLSGGKSSVFSISDGTTSKNVSITATSLDKAGNAIGNAATEAKVAEAIQAQLDTGGVKATVSFQGDRLQVKSNAVGTGAAAPTLTATSDTAGLGLGTTTTASSTPAAGIGTAASGVTSSGTEATDGSSKAAIVGTEQTATKDFSGTKDASFTLKLGSGPLKLITLNSTNIGTSGTTSQTAIAKAINDQISADTGLAGKVEASYVNNKLVISTTGSGSDQKLAITAAQVTTGGSTGVDIGFGVSGSGATAQTGVGTDVGGSKGTSSVRSSLAAQYNQILQQISQQAQDSGYNGVNLLFRNSNSAIDNTLHIAFNEKNTSALDIQGVKFDAAGLGLDTVAGGFQSDTDISAAIDKLNAATTQLRTQSSTFGANLSVVQNRQDFSKNLINILDTGSANLTNADLNEEAANSQALSTRNSIATSALSLANQAQQGVLQLLR